MWISFKNVYGSCQIIEKLKLEFGISKVILCKTFKNFTDKDGLGKYTVYGINKNRDGSIWVSTFGAGVKVFKNGKLISIEEGQEYIAKEEEKIAKGKIDEETLNQQVYSIDKKNTLKNRDQLYREIGKEAIPDSILIVMRMEALERVSANKKTKKQRKDLSERRSSKESFLSRKAKPQKRIPALERSR